MARITLLGRRATTEDAGVAANEHLTALSGAILFVLLAVEGVTILVLRPLLDVHVFVGVLLIGPVLLKLASTGYRFVRYYSGAPSYRRKGPPQLLLRLVGPPLVLATVVLLGSGIGLLAVSPSSPGILLAVHQASFVVWFGLATVHVLAYIWRVPGILSRGTPDRNTRDRRQTVVHVGVVAATLVASAIAASLVMPYAAGWVHSIAAGHARG